MNRSIEIENGRTHYFTNEEDFETAYFSFLRKGTPCRGIFSNEESINTIFVIGNDGLEKTRTGVLSPTPRDWEAPTHSMVRGLLNQFSNLSALTRVLSMGNSTITQWKSNNVPRRINFFVWYYLLCVLGISNPTDPAVFPIGLSTEVIHIT